MKGRCDNEEGYLEWAHPFPMVSRYNRRSDITKGEITEVRVHMQKIALAKKNCNGHEIVRSGTKACDIETKTTHNTWGIAHILVTRRNYICPIPLLHKHVMGLRRETPVPSRKGLAWVKCPFVMSMTRGPLDKRTLGQYSSTLSRMDTIVTH